MSDETTDVPVENVIAENPDTGRLEAFKAGEEPVNAVAPVAAAASPGKPRRSWKRGDRKAGTFDGKFVFEGATIYIQSLGNDDWDALEAKEEALQEASRDLREKSDAVNKAIADNRNLQPTDVNYVSDEELTAQRKEIRKQTDDTAEQMFQFQQQIVTQCVCFWEGGDSDPYSEEAKSELPREMVAQWADKILEKSRLGKTDADFLASN